MVKEYKQDSIQIDVDSSQENTTVLSHGLVSLHIDHKPFAMQVRYKQQVLYDKLQVGFFGTVPTEAMQHQASVLQWNNANASFYGLGEKSGALKKNGSTW